MSVPRMLRERVLDPTGSETVIVGLIAQLARKPEYAADEAFEILAQAFHGDARDPVILAAAEGILDAMARSPDEEALVARMEVVLSTRGERNAWLLSRIVDSREVPQVARLKALDLLASYGEHELSAQSTETIKMILRQRAVDDDEDPSIRERSASSLVPPPGENGTPPPRDGDPKAT